MATIESEGSLHRVRNAVKFHLERLLLRGAHYRLLFMALAVGAVSVLGGTAMLAIGEGEFADSTWWAFLRLTDPGYLGDDQGFGPRFLSTVITVAGYVLFMGALIAILTQWLHAKIETLQRGETPIAVSDHLLVLGLTERSPVVIEELLASRQRVRSFLARRGVHKMSLVVLVEDLDESLRSDLVERLGPAWDDRVVILRTGTPLIADHLRRVAFSRAAAILIPGSGQGKAARDYDAVTVKTVLAIANHPSLSDVESLPRIVAEVADPQLAQVLEGSYQGVLEVLAGDAVVSQLIAQTLRHRGLSWILLELLAQRRGKNFVFRSFPELDNLAFGAAVARLEGGVAVGYVRSNGSGWDAHLNPGAGEQLKAGDRLVVVGRRAEDLTLAGDAPVPAPPDRSAPALQVSWPQTRRVLLLGWNRRVPALLHELDTYTEERFSVDSVSILPVAERHAALAFSGVELDGLDVEFHVGDCTNVVDLKQLDLTGYHNIAILGRGWLDAEEVADAQTVLCYAILERLLPSEGRPALVIELMDPENGHLFEDRPGEVVYSPEVLGRMVAHVAIRPELHAVTRDLFTSGGADFHYRPAEQYAVAGETLSFAELQRLGQRHGEVVIGIRDSGVALDVRGDLDLAPPPDRVFTLGPNTLLLVLATDRTHEAAPAAHAVP